MSNQDDRSVLNDDALIDFEDQRSIEKESVKPKKPRIRVRMEDQRVDEIFDDDESPYVVRVSGNLSLSGFDESDDDRSAGRTHRRSPSVSIMSAADTFDDESMDSKSELSDIDTEESTDLIDVTPRASVARIKNQTISSRDDDVDGMRRHRNIFRNQGEKNSTRFIPKARKRAKHPHGYLKIVFGSMYSGKSSELRSDRNDWLSIRGIRILVVNYAHDKRYTDEDMVMTHNKEGVKCISVEHLAEITNGECYDESGNVVLPKDYDLILIDEGQFYDDLRDNIIHWVDILRRTVFVYGLDGNFRRQPFGQMLELIPMCDKVVKKKANCMMCNNGTEALFTWKLENNDDNAVTVEIGAEEKYVALCRKHYNRLNNPVVMITGNIYSKK
jgi:thymidine kinase